MIKVLSRLPKIKQNKQDKALDCLETLKEDYVLPQEQIPSKVLLLRTCEEVSLRVFKQCYYRLNYSGLGNGTEEEIIEAWDGIISEWSGLMKNEDSEYMLILVDKIQELKKHIFFVENALFVLARGYNQEIINRLISECGYDGNYPEDDKEAYLKQLERVNSLCKSHVYEVWELTDEYNRLKKTSNGGKDTEEDFDRNIHRLGKYQGYPLNQDTTTVYDFTQIHNNFIAEIQSKNPPEN